MNTTTTLIVMVLLVMAAPTYFGVRSLVRSYLRYRGKKVVTCPEIGTSATVEVDAVHAALTSALGQPSDLRLQDCSRWPSKENCRQECLANLDVGPDEFLVRGVLMRWYAGKSCVYCRKLFDDVHWIDHKPALQSDEGTLLNWDAVELQNLPTVMASYLPVCWDCYITQSFIREFPELVVYRPGQNGMHDNRGSLHT